MIDITRTREQLLIDLGASTSEPLFLQGHTVKELFSRLKAELSGRFSPVPRPELIRDLLVPLKNALGNAYKHGNQRDRTKWITVEIIPARNGALITITDEGPGFDLIATLGALRQGYRAPSERGAGFRNLERAHSLISYQDGGRTMLLCFRPEKSKTAPPPHHSEDDPVLLNVLDAEWMGQCLSSELPELSGGGARLKSCQPYPERGVAHDRCGIRYLIELDWAGHRPSEMRTLTGRLHADTNTAQDDYNAASKLHETLPGSPLKIPRPLARLAAEPRLVLYDFDAWMNLWEYLADRGSPKVLRGCAERAGHALARLHQSSIPLGFIAPLPLAGLLRRDCAQARSAESHRTGPIVQAIHDGLVSIESREPSPTHGALGWDCIHYAVDRGFYLYRFENCRLSCPELDLGGFLADLLLFSAIQKNENAAGIGREAFLGSYQSVTARQPNLGAIRVCVALALLKKLESLPTRSPELDGDLIIHQCEKVLQRESIW